MGSAKCQGFKLRPVDLQQDIMTTTPERHTGASGEEKRMGMDDEGGKERDIKK